MSAYPEGFAEWPLEKRNEWHGQNYKETIAPELKSNSATKAATTGAGKKNAESQSGFRMTAKGLLWSDDDAEKPPIVISGAFEVVAECRDDSGSSWGRLLRWKDSDGRVHEWAMPISLLAGDGLDVRRVLLDGGLY